MSERNLSKGISICMLKSLLFPSSVLEYRGLWDISRKLGLKYLTDASCEWLQIQMRVSDSDSSLIKTEIL